MKRRSLNLSFEKTFQIQKKRFSARRIPSLRKLNEQSLGLEKKAKDFEVILAKYTHHLVSPQKMLQFLRLMLAIIICKQTQSENYRRRSLNDPNEAESFFVPI